MFSGSRQRRFVPWSLIDVALLTDEGVRQPPRPRVRRSVKDDLEEGYGFVRQRMVSWFTPFQLFRTGFRAAFSSQIARAVDRRELQAAVAATERHAIARTVTATGSRTPAWVRSPPPISLAPPIVADESVEMSEGDTSKLVERLRQLEVRFDRLAAEIGLTDPYKLDLGEKEVWIDFVADLADGWNSTYAVATAVASDIKLRGLPDTLCHSKLVVFGGDVVYPVASSEEYRDRFYGPYRMAYPEAAKRSPLESDGKVSDEDDCDGAEEERWMCAIPGNHDWYDGLSSFLRYFCQARKIGGWKTFQDRSYFKIQLPGRWQLWGNDVALDARIDLTQLRYFQASEPKAPESTREDRSETEPERPAVILCTAVPAWIHPRKESQTRYENYWFFDFSFKPAVTLSGDYHAYARYEDNNERQRNERQKNKRQKIICGGGGAFRVGTNALPVQVESPKGDEDFLKSRPLPVFDPAPQPTEEPTRFYETGAAYPSRARSKRLAARAALFAFRLRNVQFLLTAGVLSALAFTASRLVHAPWLPAGLRVEPNPMAIVAAALYLGAYILLIAAFCPVSNRGQQVLKWLWGIGHALLQYGLALVAGLAGRHLLKILLGASRFDGLAEHYELILSSLLAIPIAGFLAGSLLGIYLALSNLWLGWHTREAFSSQAIDHDCCFLRLKVTPEKVTIYPIGIRRVPQRWRTRLARERGKPVFEPADIELEYHLIDGPIEIDKPD